MKREVEGLVIGKAPYQERNCIAQLLLRNGKRIAVLFYGGMGGGKNQKGSTIEVGYMLKVTLNYSASNRDLYQTREWIPIWVHNQVRYNHQAYYLLCFYADVVYKLATEDNLHDEHLHEDQQFAGLFQVMSNSVFHLEQMLGSSCFDVWSEMSLFLGKLTIQMGIFPQAEHCVVTGRKLTEADRVILVLERGGFALSESLHNNQGPDYGDRGFNQNSLMRLLLYIARMPYGQIEKMAEAQQASAKCLWDYFCYQFHFSAWQFKTLSMLF